MPGTQDCAKHRTISLISHASKVLLEILRVRLSHYITPQISEEQFGFLPGKGTTNAILTLRNIIEKTVKRQNQELWLMFVDYSKAFDTIDHSALGKALIQFGAPGHLVGLIKKLHSCATGVIQVLGDHKNPFPFGKGVRQGCILSPMIFNLCGETIMCLVDTNLNN